MNQKINAKNKMYKNVLSFLTASLATFAAFKRLMDEINNFTNLNASLDGFIQDQGKTTAGITESKSSILETLIKNTVRAARKALVFAKDNADDGLQAVFNVTATTFSKTDETTAFTNIQNVYAALNNNAAALQATYMITAADLTDISDGITAFKTQQSAPSNAVSAKAAALKGIEDTMEEADKSLDIMDDLIVNTYGDTDSELVDEYLSNRGIDNLGVRHSGIRAAITDAATDAPLEGAVMAIASLNKTATADINGEAELIRVTNGTYHVSFSMAGYITQTPTLIIEKGKIGTIAIALVSEATVPPIKQA
jgi:hypothetical protein